MSERKPLRVLIAEDSATQRQLLVTLLRSDEDIVEVAEASDGREAVAVCKRVRPDVVVMDVRMPHLDGLEATKQMMIETPTPIVLMSSLDVEAVRTSMKALDVGALTVLRKPPMPSSPHFERSVRHFISTIKAMAQVRVVRHWQTQPMSTRRQLGTHIEQRHAVVAVAASTGGPAALHRMLSMMPATFAAPILVVQHIAPGFTTGLVEWLDSAGPLTVKLAENGERLAPMTAYVAPDEHHLGLLDASFIKLDDGPAISTFRPSATYLYESVLAVMGRNTIGVILTGMGRDGVRGLEQIYRAGGTVIAQDEQTSLVFGMPQEAIAAGAADLVLPLDSIAPKLVELVTT